MLSLENASGDYIVRNFHELNGKVFYDNASGQFLLATSKTGK